MRYLYKFAVVILVVFSWSINSISLAQSKCGGTERWYVKTGIDSDASLVNVNNIVPITIDGLNKLPGLRDKVASGDNQTRLKEERVVYQVSGRLVLFKNEKDADYHLVITDDSLKYSPGGDGTDGLETGTSFIAEIPTPDCAAGKKGPSGARSFWDAQLKTVRAKFEARFPGGQPTDTDLGGIPVTLTGVLFYDRQHYQTGRAVNGVELHPLLDITFGAAPAAPSVTPPTTPTPTGNVNQLLANPGFEEGVTGWSGTVDDIGIYENETARSGNYFAWMGGMGYSHTESLYQNVSIPASANKAVLSFWLSMQTQETTKTKANDKLYVQIRDKDSHVLKSLETFSNLNKNDNYEKHEYDISNYIGQDIQVFLKALENDGKATSFKLDDFELTIQ